MMSTPPATTATVPTASAASWAAESMPRARPETTTSPAKPSSRARVSANLRASALALRAPTMATISFCSRCGWPSMLSTGGGASSAFSPRGYSGSQDRSRRPPSCRQFFQFAFRYLFHPAARKSCRRRARQTRHFFQRRGRRTEARHQIVKGDGSDILGARQPEPGAAFGLGERHYLAPMRGSVPPSSRRIFSRCIQVISSDSGSASAA